MRQAPSSRNTAPSGRKGVAFASAWLVLLSLAACSVDDRTLTTDDAIGGLGSGGGGFSGTAGEAGAAGEPTFPLCRYSGDTVDAGCETLVENPGFAVNVAGWVAEPVGVMEGWQAEDANDDSASGSLAVINTNYSDLEEAKAGTAGGGARQCIALHGGSTLDFAADVFIPKGQGAGYMGNMYTSVATLSVFYYTDAGCQGQNSSNFTSQPVQTDDKWVHVEQSTRLPKGVKSMAVRLATLKPFRQISFQAQFDNVFVRER